MRGAATRAILSTPDGALACRFYEARVHARRAHWLVRARELELVGYAKALG
jgi:hypothetical protein